MLAEIVAGAIVLAGILVGHAAGKEERRKRRVHRVAQHVRDARTLREAIEKER